MLECEFHLPSPKHPELGKLADSINKQFDLGKPAELLLIADTLTLTFDGSDHHLAGLDAYTNKQLWRISPKKNLPSIEGRGLLLMEPFRFDADRVSLDVTPHYEIAENQNWIRVILDEVETAFHYQVATNLLVGVKDEALTDIYLLNVMFM